MNDKNLTFNTITIAIMNLLSFRDTKTVPNLDDIRSIVACTGNQLFLSYLDDIGVVITKSPADLVTTVTTVDEDDKWVGVKVSALLTHLHEKFITG